MENFDHYHNNSHQPTTRPLYPQASTSTSSSATTSTSSSAFQSTSSLAFIANNSTSSATMHQPHGLTSAPLPSPSAHRQSSSYFTSIAAQQQPQQTPPTSHPQQQQQPMQSPSRFGAAYMGQRGDGRGIPETAPYLKDFNLVAEAAKRAQMACLMRDFGEVEL